MEHEIQVISPGALGNAMQPGQCQPPPALCKMGNFCGGNGRRAAPSPPVAPSIVQGWKVPEPVHDHDARGVPQLQEQRELGCPGLGSGSVGATWLPSPSPSRKTPPPVHMGMVWIWHPLTRRGTGEPH